VNKKLSKLIATTVLVSLCHFAFTQQTTVVINEIYFDINPLVGLPSAEYVELFNNSSTEVNLNGWTFKDTGSPKTIDEDFALLPGKYVLLTKADNTGYLQSYGDVIGLGSFPSLNDSGDELTLTNSNGEIAHEVSYKKSWLDDSVKDDGGWALELIDPDNYCGLGLETNWAASENPIGGTPGAINSVDGITKDEVAPAIESISVLSSNVIEVLFTESIELPGITDINNYKISNEEGNLSIINLFVCNEDNSCIEIEINENFASNVSFNLDVSNLFDCAGNEIEGLTQNFIKPGLVAPLSIVINEILFDPLTDAAEYIELYNQSDVPFDLNSLNLQDLRDTVNINTIKNVFQPQSYVLLTEDTISVINIYNPPNNANLVQVEDLPSLNNDEDVIRLTNTDFSIIDSVYYSEDWHFRLLDITDGVALERINFANPSQDANNWQSASKSGNYGTPGYQNSQTNQPVGQAFNEIINIENKTVSPDNDGFEDFLLINYQTENSGQTANVYIFNEIGQLIAHPVKNELLGETGLFKWDGLDDSGARIPLGIYIVYAEFFDLDGNLNKQKVPIVVAGKL